MATDQALLNVLADLRSRYDDDVSVLGSGRATFVRICKDRRRANISVDEEGWFVELWSANDSQGDETLEEEDVIQLQKDAIHRISAWLDG